MTRGPRKHLKRLAAPSSWMLSKMDGTFAPRPSSGPHNSQSCIPLQLLLKKLNVAHTKKETEYILQSKLVKINGRIRTDKKFPVGLFDVLSISGKFYRLLMNLNKKFYLHEVSEKESNLRISKIKSFKIVDNVPYHFTNDGYCHRFLNPELQKGDSLLINISEGKAIATSKFQEGKVAMVHAGSNLGCIGVITKLEVREIGGGFVFLMDKNGRVFATKIDNVIVIGENDKAWITLPKGEGLRIGPYEESIKIFGDLVEVDQQPVVEIPQQE